MRVAYSLHVHMRTAVHEGRAILTREPERKRVYAMERSDLPDKLFAEDTLSYPESVDGERPAQKDVPARGNTRSGTPEDDMLAVEYREEETRMTADPLEHTPAPEDLFEPGGGNPSPGADIEDETPPDRGGRTY
jgi:hypothetical protein